MKKGFTLVEVLVAVVILSIGILAVSQMTIMGMKTTSVINQRLYARTMMAWMFEDLNARPVSDSFLMNPDGGNDLADDTGGDYQQTLSDSLAKVSYQAHWNIVDDIPETGIKTVRIFIRWGPTLDHKISTDLMKRM